MNVKFKFSKMFSEANLVIETPFLSLGTQLIVALETNTTLQCVHFKGFSQFEVKFPIANFQPGIGAKVLKIRTETVCNAIL